ncbi:MAG TPA: A/G-specific adenine glycosylase, partial [Enterovirga sp.]
MLRRSTARSKIDSAPAGPAALDLLAWYDRHRRDLPWRAKPGEH